MTTDTAKAGPRMVPLREGMFRMPEQIDMPAALLGNRCRKCNERFFPPRVFCAACSSGDMEAVEFAGTGEITTCTIVHQQPPNSVMVPPYAIIRLKLDDGPQIQTVVGSDDLDAVRIGARARLLVRRMKEDDAGNTVVSFMARPIPA